MAQEAQRRSRPADVTELWLKMGYLYADLEKAKTPPEFEKVKLEARGRIKELAGLHGVDQKVRAKILKTLELVERHPSHDELGELVEATCACPDLLPHGPA